MHFILLLDNKYLYCMVYWMEFQVWKIRKRVDVLSEGYEVGCTAELQGRKSQERERTVLHWHEANFCVRTQPSNRAQIT